MSTIDIATQKHTSLAEEMRQGLRRFGKAVVVVTAWHENKRWAMTATAVSELCMDPPSLLVCINRSASLYSPLTTGANFCINILHAEQEAIANNCFGAIKGEKRFSEGCWDSAACGTPYLRGAQASFICEYEQHVEYGTHAIVIGAVKEVQLYGDVAPLIYLDGRFTKAVAA
ncbi:flavin reductase family protein [Parasphingorhabdus sp.]|uniref:flavin reductase family protein n=1 Tax=Parasphingorhabdus sp. TaxID=2709688 RepID=UPI003A8DF031